MAAEIIMPKAGMAMETGVIVQWFKKPGDTVEVGEALLEIETDKVTMEVEAEVSGVLLGVLHDAGDEVPVTRTIGYIGRAGEALPQGEGPSGDPEPAGETPAQDGSPSASSVPQPAPSGSSVPPAPGAGPPVPSARPDGGSPGDSGPAGETLARGGGSAAAVKGKVPATPAARRLAAEYGVDLAEAARVLGAFPVHAEAVRRFAARSSGESAVGAPPSGGQQRKSAEYAEAPFSAPPETTPPGAPLDDTLARTLAGISGFVSPAAYHFQPEPGDTIEPLAGIRGVTARRMVTSHLVIPPTTLHRDVDADPLLALKRNIRDGKVNVSLNDLFLAAAARALRGCPWMRVSLFNNQVVRRESVHLGMAVAGERGLLVPVIRDAERRSIIELHDIAADLAERARSGKLRPDEMQGAVFSVSNLGMYGISTFTPVVNPPEAAILGVGTVREVLRRGPEGGVEECSRIDLSLTLDHRLIDGAQGALFLRELAELIENPVRIVV